MHYDLEKDDPYEIIEKLQARIHELEDFQQRVEASAAETIGLAEELAIARDLAEASLRKELEYQETIKKMALFDPLTGIANRNQFQQKFDDAIHHALRDETLIALLVFDLDGFKEVNDGYGHPVGDELLQFVSAELVKATRETDTVARLGGDEFAIILTGLDREDRATKVAERVVKLLSAPVNLSSCVVKTGTSVGISLYPRDASEPEELMRTADMALYAAKSKGKGNFQYYDGDLDEQAKVAHVLESDLRLAIVRKEFVLHYQPQLVPSSDKVICVEALVRWNHPVRGLLYPADFIDAAENNGLLVNIGRMVLNLACKQCKAWLDEGMNHVRIAVNVSPVQFQEAGFVDDVRAALKKADLEAENLELEITESLMMENITKVSAILHQLRDLGVKISVDDFGTGYSSLAYLKKLPIQRLKIDQSFVQNLANDHNDMAITEAIVQMGQSLGLEVVAEGIEMKNQADALRERGCDQLQGYLISKPLPAAELSDWLLNRAAKALD